MSKLSGQNGFYDIYKEDGNEHYDSKVILSFHREERARLAALVPHRLGRLYSTIEGPQNAT